MLLYAHVKGWFFSSLNQATRVTIPHTGPVFCRGTFWILWLVLDPEHVFFSDFRFSTDHHQGLNMYMRFRVPSSFFLQQWIKYMLYWKKLCGKVLIIPKHKGFTLIYSPFSLFYSFIKLYTGEMCITLHLYRNSDILLYLFKTNRVLWDTNNKKKGPPNIPVKCGIFHLYLFPVADTWRSSKTCETLPVWVMVLLFTPCPSSFSRTKESVAVFYCNIPFNFSFSINCTVKVYLHCND